jgi:DNA-binding response OmpR family regulator
MQVGGAVDKVSILVIEDEVLILHVVEEALLDAGFGVVTATSSLKAIQLLDDQQIRFRAIVTDVNLGRGGSGWDVARRAREINPDIGVIYVSGHGAEEWASHGLPKSIMVTKPFANAQLITALSSLLNEHPQSG